ncbi:hypothetical protein WBG78_04705 [Chryseolinea sp. T2]|uniref:hypothetical protein n=1 Tax=Chryseolinea sp. T2 TaxID=3129255 RepID=UPI003078002E
MKTLASGVLVLMISFCAACTSRNSEQATSPTSPEDQVVPNDVADSLKADSIGQHADTASLRR